MSNSQVLNPVLANQDDVSPLQLSHQLVCSFSYSQRLVDAGFERDTFFYYLYFPNTGKYFLYRNKTAYKTCGYNLDAGREVQLIPAPISSELRCFFPPGQVFDLIPKHISDDPKEKVSVGFQTVRGEVIAIQSAGKEATARAKLLLYLWEHDLLTENISKWNIRWHSLKQLWRLLSASWKTY